MYKGYKQDKGLEYALAQVFSLTTGVLENPALYAPQSVKCTVLRVPLGTQPPSNERRTVPCTVWRFAMDTD